MTKAINLVFYIAVALVFALTALVWAQTLVHAQVPPDLGEDIVCSINGDIFDFPIEGCDEEQEPPQDACPNEQTDPGLQEEGPCNADDVCPNDDGIQTNESECTPEEEPVEDLCPNIEDVQVTVPEGMEVNDEGDCAAVENGDEGGGDEGGESEDSTPPSNGGGGGGVVGSGPLSIGYVNTGGGEVLGTTTVTTGILPSSCVPLITSYLKKGKENDPKEVEKLQAFLNGHMEEHLPVTGHFGLLTFDAVRRFQQKYTFEVLKPWMDVGLMESLEPTGYVYKTTQRMINSISCDGAEIPMPPLP